MKELKNLEENAKRLMSSGKANLAVADGIVRVASEAMKILDSTARIIKGTESLPNASDYMGIARKAHEIAEKRARAMSAMIGRYVRGEINETAFMAETRKGTQEIYDACSGMTEGISRIASISTGRIRNSKSTKRWDDMKTVGSFSSNVREATSGIISMKEYVGEIERKESDAQGRFRKKDLANPGLNAEIGLMAEFAERMEDMTAAKEAIAIGRLAIGQQQVIQEMSEEAGKWAEHLPPDTRKEYIAAFERGAESIRRWQDAQRSSIGRMNDFRFRMKGTHMDTVTYDPYGIMKASETMETMRKRMDDLSLRAYRDLKRAHSAASSRRKGLFGRKRAASEMHEIENQIIAIGRFRDGMLRDFDMKTEKLNEMVLELAPYRERSQQELERRKAAREERQRKAASMSNTKGREKINGREEK